MEMLANLEQEVLRYAECDGELVGDETSGHIHGTLEALTGVSSLLRTQRNWYDPQDSTSGQLTPLMTA